MGISAWKQMKKVISKPGFWLIVILLILISLPHYGETIKHPAFLTNLMTNLGLTRHAFERILYLAPIVWAGLLFGWRGGFITSVVAVLLMLPRAFFISEYRTDAIFETAAVFIIGNVLAVSAEALRRERANRSQLIVAQKELTASEQSYRQLFENAHDAIWLHNLEGNIITVNRAGEKLTGYTLEELGTMNVKSFLSEESLSLAGQIRAKLLDSEPVKQPYEQHIIRKDGTVAIVQLATSLVFSDGAPVAFQHIARDITEQKRLQENLRFYLQEATRAQEEERKRISRELHDETIQALVVLSRQLDAVGTDKELPEPVRQRLEELWKQTNNVMQGVRRLSQDLRPAALDRLGLLSALEWLAEDASKYSGIATKLNVVGNRRRLPEELELVLFRITQEAMRNVWRHSQATRAEISVEFNENKTRVTVSDNGQGFQLPETIGDLARHGKLGLTGMEERARLAGGDLTIHSTPGKGTTVTVELPG